MRNALAIARRELDAYLESPLPYLLAAAMLATFGYFFYFTLRTTREASLRPLFGENALVVLVFVVPVLTMRLLAEERRSGTAEILLTAPVRDREVILGKYLAGLALYLLMLAPTVYYPIILEMFGAPDWGAIISAYLGMILLGAALVSLGTFTSALSSKPIVSAVVGVALALLLWLMPAAAELVEEPLRGVLQYLGLSTHLDDLAKGVIDTRDLVYYLSITAGGLFLGSRTLEARRWR